MLCNVPNINFYWSPLTGFGDGKYRPVPRQGPRIWMYEVLSECVIASVKYFPASVTGYGLLHVLVYGSSTWHISALLLLVTGKKKGRRGIKGKVKFTLAQALWLCTSRAAHRESRCIGLPFHDHGTRRGWEVGVTPRPFLTPGKDPVPIVQEAG